MMKRRMIKGITVLTLSVNERLANSKTASSSDVIVTFVNMPWVRSWLILNRSCKINS